MNHKRRRPKNRRAGCLMCKHWKVNGSKRSERRPHRDRKRLVEGRDAVRRARYEVG